jgi:hypothetical protein
VHPPRLATTARARPPRGLRTSPDPHRPTNLLDPLDHHISQVREKNLNNIVITTRPTMITPMRSRSLHDTPGPTRSRKVGQIQILKIDP